jgi:predicted methyltransferase
MTKRLALLAVSLAALAACAKEPTAAPTPTPTPTEAPTAASLDAGVLLAAEGRLPADPADDAARKPADVLAFAGVAPGQKVFEMEAGSGWYTELLVRAVGPGGQVTMQAPPEFQEFYREPLAARLANNRLPNVRVSWTPFEHLDAEPGSVDLVTWFLGPHELHFKTPGFPNGLGDPAKVYAEVFRILKPGGAFVVMDHVANAGTTPDAGGAIHRIDPRLVRAGLEHAGFTIEEESTLLATAEDDHTKQAVGAHFKTDQFLFRAVKPAS